MSTLTEVERKECEREIRLMDMNYKILADRVRYFKQNPEGVRAMCKAMDDLRIESERRGEMKGFVEACQEFGKTVADAVVMIAHKFGLTEDASHHIVAQYWKV